MTFYEELGVPPDAPSDTIREAYRNVARLLHPDAQTNPVLKESAEAQMKRINHLYDILSDPERRRRYDQELAEPQDRPATIIIQAPRPPEQFQRGNSGTYVWLAATAICATFIIWLATRESSAPAVYPDSSSIRPSALRKAAEAILPKPDRQRDDEIARLRAELATANADRERLTKQIAATEAVHKFQPPPAVPRQQPRVTLPAAQNSAASLSLPQTAPPLPPEIPLPVPILPPAPPPATPHSQPARSAVSEAPKVRWAGAWAYVPSREEKKNTALFPPEFIETIISEDSGHIRGRYRARFKVADPKISPDVDFRFEGRVSGKEGFFPWAGTGGSRGNVQVRLISDTTLELIWTATNLGKSMGLASGTAELKRKN